MRFPNVASGYSGRKWLWPAHLTVCGPQLVVRGQAQLPPTAESVLLMLLPAVWTFWPWALACS
ncbi:MAG: hypothetical protein QOG14_2000 [Mycobacterium sp.]|jgi:hypothetical protein|nr:hypothetical protein [Mycobacterium sp.]